MNSLKQIAGKFYALLYEIILFIIGIVKQLILPTSKRKGNILQSVFIFFIGLVAIINRFEYGMFKMSAIFRQKNIRQLVIVISSLLFLLSSLEWTRAEAISKTEIQNNSNVATLSNNCKTSSPKTVSIFHPGKKIHIAVSRIISNPPLLYSVVYSTTPAKYLLFRSILI